MWGFHTFFLRFYLKNEDGVKSPTVFETCVGIRVVVTRVVWGKISLLKINPHSLLLRFHSLLPPSPHLLVKIRAIPTVCSAISTVCSAISTPFTEGIYMYICIYVYFFKKIKVFNILMDTLEKKLSQDF